MKSPNLALTLQRDIEATLIPSGVKVTLVAGHQVYVTQALGNAYTLQINGNLVRINGADGDAIGLPILEVVDINTIDGSLEHKVWAQLKTCFDPEIPVNIVDLGLIYECETIPAEKNLHHIQIVMTLTAPGCGMGPVLVEEIKDKVQQIHGVAAVQVELVFEPPWDRSRMSDEAKLQLGLF